MKNLTFLSLFAKIYTKIANTIMVATKFNSYLI